MRTKSFKIIGAAFITAIFMIATASASELNLQKYEMDCFGNYIQFPGKRDGVDTFGINQKSFSDNNWYGPPGVVPNGDYLNGYFDFTGTGTFGYTDRYGVRYSKQVTVPGGWTVWVDKLIKGTHTLAMIDGAGNPWTAANPFQWFVGINNLTKGTDLVNMQKAGYVRGYTFQGFPMLALPWLTRQTAPNYTIYARHTATGIILPIEFDESWCDELTFEFVNLDWLESVAYEWAAANGITAARAKASEKPTANEIIVKLTSEQKAKVGKAFVKSANKTLKAKTMTRKQFEALNGPSEATKVSEADIKKMEATAKTAGRAVKK